MKIHTLHGHAIEPRSPDPDAIDIRDIIISLSRQARFNGQTRAFYSVAEHSLNVASLLELDGERFAGLLHDASEAYLGDVTSPVRECIDGYEELEANMARVIAEKFGAPYPWPATVRVADKLMLCTEARDYCHESWPVDEVAKESFLALPADRMAPPMTSDLAALEYAAALGEFIPAAEEFGAGMLGRTMVGG